MHFSCFLDFSIIILALGSLECILALSLQVSGTSSILKVISRFNFLLLLWSVICDCFYSFTGFCSVSLNFVNGLWFNKILELRCFSFWTFSRRSSFSWSDFVSRFAAAFYLVVWIFAFLRKSSLLGALSKLRTGGIASVLCALILLEISYLYIYS